MNEKLQKIIISDNEQDRMEMKKWWREATEADKIAVWNAIQREHDNPVDEIVTRFAQIAFGEMFEESSR